MDTQENVIVGIPVVSTGTVAEVAEDLDKKARKYLESFDVNTRIDSLYDENAEFASALNHLYPDFEYPDWGSRSLKHFFAYLVEESLSKEDTIAPIGAPQPVEPSKDNSEQRKLLNGLYVEREPNIFYRQDSDKPALLDEGMKLKVVNKDLETFKAAIELAQSKGWAGIQVTGSEKFKSEAWYQASTKGLSIEGYEPNEKDRQRLADFHAQKHTEPTLDKEQLKASLQAAEAYALEKDSGIVYPDNVNETRNFSGRVVKILDSHVIQDLGRNTFAVHEKSRIGEVEFGSRVDIQYKGREAEVKSVNRQRSNSLER